jgi:type VI protein secretion system component VasK
MEILDLKFAGVSLWEWCGVIGFLWLVLGSYTYWLQVWRDWKERKKREEEYEAAKKSQDEIDEKVARGMRDAIARHHTKSEAP